MSGVVPVTYTPEESALPFHAMSTTKQNPICSQKMQIVPHVVLLILMFPHHDLNSLADNARR